jgi:hypothetical protein
MGLGLWMIEFGTRNARELGDPIATGARHNAHFFKYGPRDPFKSRADLLARQQEEQDAVVVTVVEE